MTDLPPDDPHLTEDAEPDPALDTGSDAYLRDVVEADEDESIDEGEGRDEHAP